jgi:hypothetical protein
VIPSVLAFVAFWTVTLGSAMSAPAWWSAYYEATPFRARFVHPPEGCYFLKQRAGSWMFHPARKTSTVFCWQEGQVQP